MADTQSTEGQGNAATPAGAESLFPLSDTLRPGMWMIDTRWCRFLAGAGVAPKSAAAARPASKADSLAVIPVTGPTSKDGWFGSSTVALRQALADAVNDSSVSGILLVIDSPGGTVSGNKDAADAVAAAAKQKPVHAYVDDLCASAAYWIASQCRTITAGPMAEVGSIGTMAAVEDISGMAEKAGIRVHVISTGAHKGAFIPGAPVQDEHLAALQARVDEMNEFFLSAVQSGRRMKRERLMESADGQVFLAADAQKRGLIDAVGTMDDAVATLAREARTERRVRQSAEKLHAEKVALADRKYQNQLEKTNVR